MKDNVKHGDDLLLVPVHRAAELLGVSPRTFRRMTAAGAVKTVRTSAKDQRGRYVSIQTLRDFVHGGGVQTNAVNGVYC